MIARLIRPQSNRNNRWCGRSRLGGQIRDVRRHHRRSGSDDGCHGPDGSRGLAPVFLNGDAL
jgi:hypothetical protein